MELEDLKCSFSLSPSAVRFTLVFLLLLFSYTPVEGQFRVIGSSQPIVAALGDDVILPCHVEPIENVTGLTVEWSKPDLQPDHNNRLHQVEFVHLYRDKREDTDMKLSSYEGRTTLFTDGLHRGNISLKITNVTFGDAGRYKCFLPKLEGQHKFSFVTLKVVPNSPETFITEVPLTTTINQILQLPESQEKDDEKGGLSNWIWFLPVFCILLVLIVGLTWKLRKCPKQEPEETMI